MQGAGAAADRAHGGDRVAAPVRVLAAPALVQRQGERVDVGLGARLEALGLLGGHVGERADHVAGRRQPGRVGDQGDAEVHQLGARLAVDDLDVLRLDVAVDDAARVGVVERLAEVGADLADLAVRQRVFAGQAGEGRALDQLGDEQRVAVLLPHLVEGHDAGVVEAGRRLRLAHAPASRPRRAARSPSPRPAARAARPRPRRRRRSRRCRSGARSRTDPIQVSRPSPLGVLRAAPSSCPSMVGKKAPFAASSSAPLVLGAILPRQSTSLGEPFLGVLVFTRRAPVPPAEPPTRAPADHAAAPARPGRGAGRADPGRARGEGLPRLAGARGALRATPATSNRSSTRPRRRAKPSSANSKTRGNSR